ILIRGIHRQHPPCLINASPLPPNVSQTLLAQCHIESQNPEHKANSPSPFPLPKNPHYTRRGGKERRKRRRPPPRKTPQTPLTMLCGLTPTVTLYRMISW